MQKKNTARKKTWTKTNRILQTCSTSFYSIVMCHKTNSFVMLIFQSNCSYPNCHCIKRWKPTWWVDMCAEKDIVARNRKNITLLSHRIPIKIDTNIVMLAQFLFFVWFRFADGNEAVHLMFVIIDHLHPFSFISWPSENEWRLCVCVCVWCWIWCACILVYCQKFTREKQRERL